jgi:hypothetical protein
MLRYTPSLHIESFKVKTGPPSSYSSIEDIIKSPIIIRVSEDRSIDKILLVAMGAKMEGEMDMF